MNIDKLVENTGPQAAQKNVAINAIRRPSVAECDAAPNGDQVDMSMIGRLMARSVRALADSEDVRPEVLERHKELPKQTARFDDRTIEQIFRRMR